MTACFRLVLRLLLLVLVVPLVRAQPLPEVKWSSSEPHEGQGFGSDVAIQGVVAVVGAPAYDPDFSTLNYGAVYVYRYDGNEWAEEEKLTKAQPQISDQFGRSVALAFGTDTFTYTLLVGMSNDEEVASNEGAAYVYRIDESTVEHEATLVASDGASGDNFGYSLSVVDGADYVIWRSLVGSPRHNITGFNREGAAYMYRYDDGDWVEEAKLTASDAGVNAKFGEAVAVSGDRALIGAPGDFANGAGQNAGAAYVFEYDGSKWVEIAKLIASDPEGQAAFGGAVALDGDRALIGARLDRELGGGAGAAYVFHFDGTQWNEEQKLLSPDHTGFNLFGSAVALDGEQALVGVENGFLLGGDGTGRAFLFAYNADLELWEPQEHFVPTDGGPGDQFGGAVSLDDGVVLVGAPDHDRPVGGNGAVYVYGKPSDTGDPPQQIGEIARFTDSQPPFNKMKGVAAGDINGDGIPEIAVMQDCTLQVVNPKNGEVLWVYSLVGDYNNDGAVDASDYIVCPDGDLPDGTEVNLIGFVDFSGEQHAIVAIERLERGIIAILIGLKDNEIVYHAEARVVAVLQLPDGRPAVVTYEAEKGGGLYNIVGEVTGGTSATMSYPTTTAYPTYSSRSDYQLDLKFQAEPGLRLGYDPDLSDPPGDTDLDGDGYLDIPMLIISDGQPQGVVVRGGATLEVLWHFPFPDEHRENIMKGFHGFADVDADGQKEALVGENLAITLDGTVHTIAENFVTLDLIDVDGDGYEDIVGLNTADSSIVVYGAARASTSAVGADPAAIGAFLFQNYPNPFREHTTIAYEVERTAPVTVTVYDVRGRRVRTLVNDVQPAGRHQVTWNGRDDGGRPTASGMYFYRLLVGEVSSSKQALYIK